MPQGTLVAFDSCRLLVAGLELSPQLAKRGLEGSMVGMVPMVAALYFRRSCFLSLLRTLLLLHPCRLLVAGLELSPQVAKRGLEGSMGWDGAHHDEEQRVAAALGYVAAMVRLVAGYLDVPLRFPLAVRSSRSWVADLAPLRQQLLEGGAGEGGFCGGFLGF